MVAYTILYPTDMQFILLHSLLKEYTVAQLMFAIFLDRIFTQKLVIVNILVEKQISFALNAPLWLRVCLLRRFVFGIHILLKKYKTNMYTIALCLVVSHLVLNQTNHVSAACYL